MQNEIFFDSSYHVALRTQESLRHKDQSRQQAESVLRWRRRVDRLKTEHVSQIFSIRDALLRNRPLSEAIDRNENFVVNAFLNSPDVNALKAVLTEKSRNGLKEEENGGPGNENQMKIESLFRSFMRQMNKS